MADWCFALDSPAIEYHKKLRGKIFVSSKKKIETINDLSLAYTPGVADVSRAIHENKNLVYSYTIKGNSVAIVTDGSAVLGLGNIGPEAALPVMEGKALLMKEFAGIDAFPICLRTQKVDEIVSIVENISPVFGGINLEDISAPRCFEVEERLQEIGIPVVHDDQHGTAIVVLAALINASEVAGKDITELNVVINGAGAAGNAIANFLSCFGDESLKVCRSVADVIICDSQGIIHSGRDLCPYKERLCKITNKHDRKGSLADAMSGADVFIGVSRGNLVSPEMVSSMADKPIVFAMANPVPEIMPDAAKKGGAFIVATGRSDFPNQVNNALAFPGVFRGLLDSGAKKFTNEMKINSSYVLAKSIKNPDENRIVPSIFDKSIVQNISDAIKKSSR
jgi:malate dehydrogenase (oxaloacetate-decarboxylating)